MATVATVNIRKMRYTGGAMAALKTCNVSIPQTSANLKDTSSTQKSDDSPETISGRVWTDRAHELHPPTLAAELRHKIGNYPLTSELAAWAQDAAINYHPPNEVRQLVEPFSRQLHAVFDRERESSTGFHDLNLVELTYQITLEVGAQILLAADATNDPINLQIEFHSSKAAKDDHFAPWGRLLTGLECDPPIISQFPVYLMMCQSFTFESTPDREDYIFSALTGVDWAKGKNVFSQRFEAFEKLALSSVPTLNDKISNQDRSFWRIALAYLRAINDCENSRKFKAPAHASIQHDIDHDLVIAARAFDTIGSAFMCSDGAAWLDEAGLDSLIGSAVPNDVMDLHTDIITGETRNLLRLLYPTGLCIDQTLQIASTLLSGMLCEVFRGHHRARLGNREDGRIAATSPSYSFCRARHRRIFETLETYCTRYPQFWEWTWDIYHRAKDQITEAGLKEPLVDALKRARTQDSLPSSPRNSFYDLYWEMMEEGAKQMDSKNPLGVSEDLADVTRNIYDLWHPQLLSADKQPGWGRDFDIQSDRLFAQAGHKFLEEGQLSDNVYKFSIAYGRLSMAMPYIAYHTVAAIIMAYGIIV